MPWRAKTCCRRAQKKAAKEATGNSFFILKTFFPSGFCQLTKLNLLSVEVKNAFAEASSIASSSTAISSSITGRTDERLHSSLNILNSPARDLSVIGVIFKASASFHFNLGKTTLRSTHMCHLSSHDSREPAAMSVHRNQYP